MIFSKLIYSNPRDECKMRYMRTMSFFAGLRFLFVPNSHSGLTNIRKALAIQNGATIVNDWKSSTHVLVDNRMVSHSQLSKRFGSKEGFTVLKQDWLADCLEKKALLPTEDYLIQLTPTSAMKKSTGSPSKKHAELEETLSPHIKIHNNPNQKTIDIFSQMCDQHKIKGEQYRVKAYKSAIDTLQKTATHITSYDQALKLPGIGVAFAKKIEEIARTHHLTQLDNSKQSKDLELMKLFKGIHGVGTVIAQKWIDEGMRSLHDISIRSDLTSQQRLGLQYYDDWNLKIPREEVKIHADLIEHCFNEIDPYIQATLGGSYRRGSKLCGDVDFIITKEGASMPELHDALERLLEKLKEEGYFRCLLQHRMTNKLLSGCALPPHWNKKIGGKDEFGPCRRVDFLLVPWNELGAAMIYFTGNDEFNKKLRFRAQKRGMILNSSGLFKVVRDKKTGADHQELVESFDEKKIMNLLGVDWHEPEQRDIGGSNIP